MTTQIGDNILYTRDIDTMIEDLEELEEAFVDAKELHDEAVEGFYGATAEQLEQFHKDLLFAAEQFSADDRDLLKALRDFKEELEGYVPDWRHGEALINEDYRAEYVQEFAPEIPSWVHIDWEETAAEFFQHDYTYATLEGETYYVRCS